MKVSEFLALEEWLAIDPMIVEEIITLSKTLTGNDKIVYDSSTPKELNRIKKGTIWNMELGCLEVYSEIFSVFKSDFRSLSVSKVEIDQLGLTLTIKKGNSTFEDYSTISYLAGELYEARAKQKAGYDSSNFEDLSDEEIEAIESVNYKDGFNEEDYKPKSDYVYKEETTTNMPECVGAYMFAGVI